MAAVWQLGIRRSAGVLSRDFSRNSLPEIRRRAYTIARILAHMLWWQRRRLDIAKGGEFTEFKLRVDDWPDAGAEDWSGLVEDFLKTTDEIIALAGGGSAMALPVFEDRNAGCMLVSHTTHNAYHLGQIVLLLKLMGEWEEN